MAIHISQLANERVNNVEDVVKLGDEVLVKVTEIDKQGRVNVSRKALLNEEKRKIFLFKPTKPKLPFRWFSLKQALKKNDKKAKDDRQLFCL